MGKLHVCCYIAVAKLTQLGCFMWFTTGTDYSIWLVEFSTNRTISATGLTLLLLPHQGWICQSFQYSPWKSLFLCAFLLQILLHLKIIWLFLKDSTQNFKRIDFFTWKNLDLFLYCFSVTTRVDLLMNEVIYSAGLHNVFIAKVPCFKFCLYDDFNSETVIECLVMELLFFTIGCFWCWRSSQSRFCEWSADNSIQRVYFYYLNFIIINII